MGEPAFRPATYQDILDAPAHIVAEIIGGRLVTHPRPRPRHVNVASGLGIEIGGPFQKGRGGPGGWWILDEPELHLGDDVLVPDLAGWRRERMPKLPETAWFELPPDWVCEVISPSTARYDRLEKRAIYARHGVKHLWFVDPDTKTLEAFELRPRSSSEAIAQQKTGSSSEAIAQQKTGSSSEAIAQTKTEWSVIATHADDDMIAVPPFEAVPFSLAALWAE